MNQKTKISPFTINILFLVMSIIGIALIMKLSVSLNPSQHLPTATIRYSWHGATALVIEQEVTSRLEAVFASVKGVTNIESYSQNNYGEIVLEFDKSVNSDYIRFELSMMIRKVYPDFPEQVSYPTIYLNKPDEDNENPILSYTIAGPAEPYIIQKYAQDHIHPEIAAIEGIDRVSIYGAVPLEWEIKYNSNQLNTLKLNSNQIKTAINQYFDKNAIGFTYDKVFNQQNSFYVVLKNYNDSIKWDDILLETHDNRYIKLTDIAKISQKEQKPYSYYRINGLNSIYLVIYADKNVNQLTLADNIKNNISRIKKELPPNYSILQTSDSTTFISKELNKISKRTLFTVLILLAFILLISKQLKYLLLIFISLFTNLAIAVVFYYWFDVGIHLYSLAGITVSFGLMIDNSIVMIDHIKHHKNKKVFLAILASTLTTIGALIVIFFLDEKIRLNLIDFASVIIINLIVSLIIALFFIPSLMHYISLNKKKKKQQKTHRTKKRIVIINNLYIRFIYLIIKRKKLIIILFILLFGLPVYKLPDSVLSEKWYATIYNHTLGTDFYKNNIKPITDKAFGGTLRLFEYYVFENSYYSDAHRKTELYVNASMQQGSTIEQLNEAFKLIENYLASFTEIDKYVTKISSGARGNIRISFKPEFEMSNFPYVLKARLIGKVMDLDAINWNIYGVGNGFDNYKGEGIPHFRVPVYGYNYDELNRLIEIFAKKLMEHPRVPKVTVNSYRSLYYSKRPDYEYVFRLDRLKAALQNVSPVTVYNLLKEFTYKKYPDMNYIIGEDLEYITLRSQKSEYFDLWHLYNYPFMFDDKTIRLNQLGSIKKERTGENVLKINQQYKRIVEFDYTGTEKFGKKHLEKVTDEMQSILPMGYTIEKPDTNWYFMMNKEKKQYWLLLIVIGLIFIICAILLESFKQPLAVIFTIPISYIGVFLTFYWFDINFDQGGYASFILLSGLTVNSALYIVNEYNNLRKQNPKQKLMKHYIKAYNRKIIPIIITILSTALGLIPFLTSGQNEVFWYALAAGTIGGLVFSIVAIYILLPIIIITRKK